MTSSYLVNGMTCDGCARAVRAALGRVVPSGTAVAVDLKAGQVTVEGTPDERAVARAIEAAGFGYGGRC